MRAATALAALLVILSIAASAHAANYYSIRNQLISARRRRTDEKIKTLFEEWTARRGKIYSQIEEKDRRFEVFKDNLKFVESHNSNNGNRSFRLGLNKFADLTNEEYRAAYLGTSGRGDAARRFVRPEIGSQRRGVDGPPEFVDLRERGASFPVKHRRTCDGYENVPQNEKALQKALTHQPIRVVIEASGRALQLYSSGVFTGECGMDLDHSVVVVGYGSESGLDYWIVKNSWGSDWGENGYLKLERNVGIPYGKCGIVMEACYPMKGETCADSDMVNASHAAE